MHGGQEMILRDSRLLAVGVGHNGCVSVSHFVCLLCPPSATYVGDDRRLSALPAHFLALILAHFLATSHPMLVLVLCLLLLTESKGSKCSLNNLKLIGPARDTGVYVSMDLASNVIWLAIALSGRALS